MSEFSGLCLIKRTESRLSQSIAHDDFFELVHFLGALLATTLLFEGDTRRILSVKFLNETGLVLIE